MEWLIPNNDNLINRIYESESSELFFEERLSHVKLDIDNVPIEMYDRSNDLHDPTWDATVKYSARLESSTFNVSKIIFKIISVKLNVSIIKSTADNEDGSESDIEDEVDEFEVTLTGELSDPKIEVLYAPYVLDNLTRVSQPRAHQFCRNHTYCSE